MKKFIILFLIFFTGLFSFVMAEDISLPSETGIVKSIKYVDDDLQQDNLKQLVNVEILTGEFKGTNRTIENMLTGNPAYDIKLSKGDKVVLHVESKDDVISTDNEVNFYIADIKRDEQVGFFALLFAILLIIIGAKKGIYSIVSIISILILISIMIPVILNGFSPILASVIVGILSTVITIYLVGGRNSKSTSAIIGTSASLIFAAILSVFSIYLAHLTGFSGESNMFLYSARPDLDFKGILAASMIIAALGALMDTSMSIASTINEIHETDNSLTVSQLFKSGMNVGHDIIGTMSNTLILVYLGSSLPLVLLANNIDLHKFFNLNQVATEMISALIGSTAILACVPLTAIISAILIKKHKEKNSDFNLERIDIE